jgi:hypothetical protein
VRDENNSMIYNFGFQGEVMDETGGMEIWDSRKKKFYLGMVVLACNSSTR